MFAYPHRRNTVCFVCTANTCRSPIAEALCRRVVREEPQFSYDITSAGTVACNGQRASDGAVQTLRDRGIDITAHRSKKFSLTLERRCVAAFGLTQGHVAWLKKYCRHLPTKDIYLVGDAAFLPKSIEIGDPIGGNSYVYQMVTDLLEELMPALVQFVLSHYSRAPSP